MECIKPFYYEPSKNDDLDGGSSPLDSKPPSLSSLIAWNISKVQEHNPELDIKDAIATAQCRLEQDAHEIDAILSENPYTRYLSCALLAWQQLGHKNVDSLCRFVENKKEEECAAKLARTVVPNCTQLYSTVPSQNLESICRTKKESTLAKAVESSSFYSNEMGPVVKLPVETKIVMRVESGPSARCHGLKKMKAPEKNIMDKIDKACCLDSRCSKQLMAMDKSIKELKDRVVLLARREADRIELIERAEAAWRDLELGYHRRLRRAEEKEADLAKQIEKAISERTAYKNECPPMTEQLKSMSGLSEKDNIRLNNAEKELYTLACERVKLSQECAKGDAVMTEHACKAAQLDRDLQFKEEQARRKVQSLRSELDSARAITHDAERALRADLNSLREQLSDVSKQLLAEDAETDKIKLIMDDLHQEKNDIIEDLEGCKTMCEGRMKGLIDEVKSKTEKLASLKDKVLECRCKVPIDANVEVKRTPSLAALCKCTPADRIKTSCSCTSMRGRLMSDVLADLFGGLQAEMGTTVTMMSCQLLKCLEDKHNWDRVTTVKTSLKNYFSQLLVGELDIAIATSIEKYHAKWVGTSCADDVSPDTREADIERRAKSLASQLAEQLFEEKSVELEKRAKDLMASGPPPCNCNPTIIANAALQSKVLTSLKSRSKGASFISPDSTTPIYWHQAIHDVTQLRQQIQDLQKDSLKKEDLKTIEDKLAKMMRASVVPKSASAWKEEADWRDRPWKKYFNICPTLRADEKRINEKVANVSTSHAVAFPCLVKNRLATDVPPGSETPCSWHQAMQNVTQLRLLVQSLEKDSLKKEDLKMMEDKFAKIIQRASESRSPTSPKANNSTSVNINKVVGLRSKVQKINRAVNHSGLNIFDNINKPSTTKRNSWDSSTQIKKRRSFFKHGIDKTFPNKRNENTYAVNMCLCNTKKRKQILKDSVSQKSSCMKSKSKPITTKHLSKDLNRQNSKDSEEQSCPSNCGCFHKIPSTTSIDKLLDTLAKWQCDLDASCNDQLSSDNDNVSLINDENLSLISKTNDQVKEKSRVDAIARKNSDDKNLSYKSNNSDKPSEKSPNGEFNQKISEDKNLILKFKFKDKLRSISQEKPSAKKRESISVQGSTLKQHLNKSSVSKTSKNSEKNDAKRDPIETTESEYMREIHLDKSNEEVLQSVNDTKKDLEETKLEINHIEKQKYSDVSGDKRDKKDYRIKEITVLRNIQKTKERNKSQYQEKETTNNLNNAKTNANVIDACGSDYQIKFLGVTLADVNPPIINKILFDKGDDVCYNKNMVMNNTVSQEKNNSIIKKNNIKLDKNKAYSEENNTDYKKVSVAENSRLLNTMGRDSKNIFNNNNDGHDECSNCDQKSCQPKTCPRSKEKKKKGMRETFDKNEYNENKTHDEYKNVYEHRLQPGYFKGLKADPLCNSIKYKHDEPDFRKSTIGQYTTDMKCKNNLSKKCSANMSSSINNAETDISNYTLNAAYKNVRPGQDLVSEMYSNVYNQQECMLEDKDNITESLRLTNAGKKESSEKDYTHSCQCSVNFAKLKNFLKISFENSVANEDVALDVQSFKHFSNKDESCVCCNNLNTDESKDLEDNAFHLLEEYLKKKLDEFKATSCSSLCIPPIEEEKLFTVILQRVKQLIADSTNEITCKCSPEQVKSQGSWNRAYGLLQEYLKIKIKKVQCSCLLAEDNKDTILPNVLDKVSHLIDYDFQRLKDVCGCKNHLNSQGNTENYLKCSLNRNPKAEVPEKDSNVVQYTPKDNEIYHQITDDSKRSNVNQMQATVEKKSKNVNIQASAHSLNNSEIVKHPQSIVNTIRGNTNQDQETVITNNKNLNMQASACSLNKYRDNTITPETIVDPIRGTGNRGQSMVETNSKNVNMEAKCKYEDCNCVNKIEAQLLGTQLNENNEKCDTDNAIKKQKIINFRLLETQLNENYDTDEVTNEQKSTQFLTASDLNNSKCMCNCNYDQAINSTVGNQITNFLIESLANDNIQTISYNMTNDSTIASVNLNNEHGSDEKSEQKPMCVSSNLEQKENAELAIDYNQSVSHTNTEVIYSSGSSNINTIISKNKEVKENNEKPSFKHSVNSRNDIPYIGNTIDCNCSNSFGTCVCSKSKATKADADMVNTIWKKSTLDETCSKKVSYIMNKHQENIKSNANLQIDMSEDVFLRSILKKNTVKDGYFHKSQITLSISNEDYQFVLKKSIENVAKAHAKVNTLEDVTSVDTNYSINEESIDWCEYNPNKHIDSEQLKNSLYFPAPMVNNDLKNNISPDEIYDPVNEFPKHVCECEMVPICHVKMLVENIESKLANAKCTCDSLITKVCPVHSRK